LSYTTVTWSLVTRELVAAKDCADDDGVAGAAGQRPVLKLLEGTVHDHQQVQFPLATVLQAVVAVERLAQLLVMEAVVEVAAFDVVGQPRLHWYLQTGQRPVLAVLDNASPCSLVRLHASSPQRDKIPALSSPARRVVAAPPQGLRHYNAKCQHPVPTTWTLLDLHASVMCSIGQYPRQHQLVGPV
jgi:hypothetical protein